MKIASYNVFVSILISILLNCFYLTYAGWVFTGQYIVPDKPTIPQRIFIEGSKVKFEQHDFIFICDFSKESIIVVDIPKKEFAQASLNDFIRTKQNLLRENMQLVLKHIPSEERNFYQGEFERQISKICKLPDSLDDNMKITLSSHHLKVLAGDSCDYYKIYLKSGLIETVWMDPSLKSVYETFDWKTFYFYKNLIMGNPDHLLDYKSMPEYLDFLKKGFPMRYITTYKQETEIDFQINDLDVKKIPDYEFYTPSLCKEISIEKWLRAQLAKQEDHMDQDE